MRARSAGALAGILALAACAATYAGSQFPDPRHHAVGDFDGDGRRDRADFEEDEAGNLVVAVRRAAASSTPDIIWGGDISATPRYVIAAAPPGTHHTDCEAYGGCTNVPAQVTLTHEGIIVRELDGSASLTLYYWDGSSFQNIALRP